MKKTEWGVVALVLMIAPLSYVLGGTQGGTGGTQGTTHAGPTANHGPLRTPELDPRRRQRSRMSLF